MKESGSQSPLPCLVKYLELRNGDGAISVDGDSWCLMPLEGAVFIVDDVMVGIPVAVYVVVSGGGEKVYHRFYTMPVCLPASVRSCLLVCLPA